MGWTERQQKAIDSRGKNLLVAAAAGSGKTAVLVERIKKLLIEENRSLLGMLIVTFTSAAAAEMKEKIYKSLSSAAAESADDSKRHFLRHELSNMGLANISTFHSFALDVIRNYYHVAGLKPGLTVMDEAMGGILMDEAMEELFEDGFEASDSQFISFLDCYCSSKNQDGAKEMIFNFHHFLQSLPDPENWLAGLEEGKTEASDAYLAFILKKACAEISYAEQYIQADYNLLTAVGAAGRSSCPLLAAKVSVDIESLHALEEIAASGDAERLLAAMADFKFQAMRVTKKEQPDYDLIRDESDALRGFAKEHLQKFAKSWGELSLKLLDEEAEAMRAPLKELAILTRSFSERYAKKKEEKGVIDFSDIEHFALKILEDERVCEEYRQRFEYIFIDEYQDSNLVQEALISRISRPDNLFMVGDIKQSIYKFRLAEPEIFSEKYARYKAGEAENSEVIDLNSNFRSKGGVIDTVNAVFSKVMTKESSDIEYDDDAALKEGLPYTGEHIYTPELYIADASAPDSEEASDDDEEELKGSELEARLAANIIHKYHGTSIDDKGVVRKLRYSDMVILLRAGKSKGEVYYKALTQAGIPVFLERGDGYFDTVEISLFLSLLRLIDNGHNDIELLAVMRSFLFSFTDDELARVRIFGKQNGIRGPYWMVLDEYCKSGDEPLKAKCSAMIKQLERWRLEADYTPLGDFLWKLLTDTGFSDFAGALAGGGQRLANLRALVEKAEGYESRNADGLYGFLSYIDMINSRRIQVKTGQVKILAESADCVRIMTIHKSKGLEFPFVLLAGLGDKLLGPSDKLPQIFHRRLGSAIRLVNPKTSLYTDTFRSRIIKRLKDDEERAESIRLLYVAMTRPKDILVMSAVSRNPQKTINKACSRLPGDVFAAKDFLSLVLPEMKGRMQIITREELSGGAARAGLFNEDIQAGLACGFETALSDAEKAEIQSRLAFAPKGAPESSQKTKYSVSELAGLMRSRAPEAEPCDITLRTPLFLTGERRLTASEKGTAYHCVLEHIPFTKENKTPEGIKNFIDGLVEKDILTEAEGACVEPERISEFFSSDIGKRALASKELHREESFVLKTTYEGRSVLVQGTIDCCFEEDGSYVLVDYKNSYVDKDNIEESIEKIKASYIPQLALYREALEKITGRQVKEAVLYLISIGREIRLS